MNLRKIIREELSDKITLINPNENSSLEDEFGISLNTNNFLGSDETFYNIYKGEDKIGFVVISTDRYNHYNFDEILGGRIIYLNFIRLRERGFLREVINELKEKLKDSYDYILLEIGARSYEEFKILENKYKSIGFKGILPDDISEYSLELPDGIDPYEDDIFMYTEIK